MIDQNSSTERHAVPGCRVQSLGVMRYVPVADPVAEVPSLAWNRDNALQDMLVRKVFRRDIAAAALRPVPKTEMFLP